MLPEPTLAATTVLSSTSLEKPIRDRQPLAISSDATNMRTIYPTDATSIHAIKVSVDTPDWITNAWRQLAKLAELPRNWNGKTLAANGGAGEVVLWDSQTGREVRRLTGSEGSVWALAYSPDGRLLAAADDKTVRLWETATGRERLRLTDKPESSRRFVSDISPFVAFSPDGRRLAAGGRGVRFVTLWDTATGQEACQLSLSGSAVLDVAFSPDGRRLAAAAQDTTVVFWDLSWRLQTAESELPNAKRDEFWKALADADPAKAQRVIAALVGAGDVAVAFLAGRLKPVQWGESDTAQVRRLIAELGSDSFTTRQNATNTLRDYGELAEPMLREALGKTPTLETRHRIEGILSGLINGVLPEATLRELRAVEALEHIGTKPALQLLTQLASGVSTARLTRESNASVERLKKRPADNP